MVHKAFTIPAMPQMEFSIVKTALDALSPRNRKEAHIHNRCEIYINLSGDVSFAVEGRLYPVSRGSVIITMPYEYHHCIYHSNAPHQHYWITFSSHGEQDFLKLFFDRKKGTDNRLILDEHALQETCGLLDALIGDPSDELDRRIKLLHFFQILANAAPVNQAKLLDKISPDVVAALEYIEHHLCEDLDIRTLANACHVSVNTLERHFKESLGDTPFAAIRKKRLYRSIAFLRNGDPVTEAAQKSGFPDYSGYIQLFRKQFGITPGKYKKTLQENR